MSVALPERSTERNPASHHRSHRLLLPSMPQSSSSMADPVVAAQQTIDDGSTLSTIKSSLLTSAVRVKALPQPSSRVTQPGIW